MPKPADFGLYKGNDVVGRLIRFGEWLNGNGFSPYSHAFVLLDDGTIIEAEPGGARIRPVTEYAPELVTWSNWDLTDAERAAIVTAARGMAGTPYSFLDYFAIAAHRFHLPVPWLRQYIASTRHRICSQSVDYCYKVAGVNLFTDGRWEGWVTPADLSCVLKGPI